VLLQTVRLGQLAKSTITYRKCSRSNFLLLCLIYILVTANNWKMLKLMSKGYSLGLQPMDFHMPVDIKYQILVLGKQIPLNAFTYFPSELI